MSLERNNRGRLDECATALAHLTKLPASLCQHAIDPFDIHSVANACALVIARVVGFAPGNIHAFNAAECLAGRPVPLPPEQPIDLLCRAFRTTPIIVSGEGRSMVTTLGGFLDMNEGLDREEIATLAQNLVEGVSTNVGGGAAPMFTITRKA